MDTIQPPASKTDRFILLRIWDWLTQPPKRIPAHQHKQARLLSVFLVTILVLGLVYATVYMWFLPEKEASLATFVVLGVVALVYGISRTGQVIITAMLTVIVLSVGLFSVVINSRGNTNASGLLVFLVIPVLIGNIFLTSKQILGLVVLQILGILLLPFVISTITESELLLGVVPFLWITTTILMISNLHRDELEKDRQSKLAVSERFARSTIDALSAHIAVVNATGTIVAVNRAWRAFAEANPPIIGNVYEGANYLTVCEGVHVDHPDYETAFAVARGIRDVLSGQEANFTLEYSCPSVTENYWFIVHVTRFPGDGLVYAAIAHENITKRKQAEVALKLSENRFRTFFEDVPVAIWEEDFSLVKQYLDSLKKNGVTDIRAYFEMYPQEVNKCAEMIRLLDVNNTALKMYKTENKEALFASTMQTASQGEQENNREDFIAIAEGRLSHRWEGADQTLAGDPIEISLSWSVVPGYEHDYSKVIVTTLDITELKRAEDQLRSNQEQLLSLVKEAPISIAMLDRDMRYIVTSQRWIYDYGRGYSDLVGLSHYGVNPDIPERWKTMHQQGLSGETLKNDDDMWLLEDGSKSWLRWAIVPWHDASGNVGGIIISAEDITERKQAEEDLRFHEAILRETGQIAKVGGWTFDIRTGDGYWTEEVARIHDLDPNDPTSKDIGLSFYVDESRALIEAAIQKTVESAVPYDLELEMITAKGNDKWVRTIGHPIIENGTVVSIRGSFQDITEQKQAQRALVESNRQFRTLFEASPDAVVLINPIEDWKIFDCNTAACHMNGYTREELIGQSIDILNLAPADPAERVEYLERIRETGVYQLETFHRRKDGSVFPVEVSTSLITWGGREIILGIDRDITERRKAEEELRHSETRLNGVIQSAMDAIISIDSEQSIILFNAAAEKMFGMAAAHALGQPLEMFIPDRFRAGHAEHIRIFGRTGMTNRAMGALGMIAGRRANGEEFPIEASISQIETSNDKLYTVILRDITERREAEEQIRTQANRLKVLADASRAFATAGQDLHAVLDQVAIQIAEVMGDNCIISLVSDDEKWLNSVAFHNPDPKARKSLGTFLTQATVSVADPGITQQVFRTGQSLLIPVITVEQAQASVPEKHGVAIEQFTTHSAITVPMRVHGRTIGVITMGRYRSEQPAFVEDDRELAQDLADRAALAVTNARLFELVQNELEEKALAEEEIRKLNSQLEQRVESRTAELRVALQRTETLYSISRATVESENLLDALNKIVHQVTSTLLANRVSLILFDQKQQEVAQIIRGGPGIEKIIPTISYEELIEGLTGWVVRERRSTLSPKGFVDIRESEAVQKRRRDTQCGSVAVVPLQYLDQILGTLTAINLPEERDFSEADLKWMEGVANQTATALVRAELHENLQTTNLGLQTEINERKQLELHIRKNQARVQTLADLSQVLAEAGLEQQMVFKTIAQRISELLGDSCNISLISSDGKWLETQTVFHPDPDGLEFVRAMIGTTRYGLDEGIAGRAAKSGEPLLIPNISQEVIRAQMKPEFLPYLERFGIASILVVPIRTKERVLGTIGLSRDKPGNPYTPEDQAFLQGLADRVGLALENKRLFLDAQRAREDADRANLAKSEFLSRMSHELRTPLNAILGFGQLFGMDALNAQQSENINHILRAGKHLLGLINEVLDITRIETGNLSISREPVRVKDLIEETLELVEGMAARRSILVQSAKLSLEYVQADRQRLKQILLNLLSNAIKYNREEGKVIIDCLEVPGERLRIRITDTGPGISAQSQTRLFVPFDRLGAEKSQVEGTGLGLSLSRRLAEAMGGRLEVESVLGKGSTFWVELPIVESPMEQSYHHQDGILQLSHHSEQTITHTVLCFEDNLSNLQLIEQIFKLRAGVKLLAAAEGLAGLEIARMQPPDLILLDVNLPDITGNEVLHRLKAHPSTQAIPVVVLSADATPGQVHRLMEAGAKAYLTKPLDISQFLKVLDETFDNLGSAKISDTTN